MLKFISENKIKNYLKSVDFLALSCTFIFLLSIFFRSTIDIGADTGVYLDLGQKVAEGKKYYYDFFESNFPLSFYYYALQFKISQIPHLSPIILSEIFINILAILSIFWSAKILQKSIIYGDKLQYNFIIIAYFFGFFLRPNALQIGEFGTKTSLLLIALFPYISYSFTSLKSFSNKDLLWRGLLMGALSCIKPHYLIFIIFIEGYNFFKKPTLKFFFELDKLVMILVGEIYLLLMLKFTPEFFEFMVPMWSQTYSSYSNNDVFLENSLRHFASRILPFSFIFLIFSRLKFTRDDKIILLFFAAVSVLMIAENAGTVDQVVIFYAITTICFAKLLRDLTASKKILFAENKFIITALIFIPVFDMSVLPASIFGLGGFVNIWWLFALFYPLVSLRKEINPLSILLLVLLCLSLFAGAVFVLKYVGPWAYITFNLSVLFAVLFVFEKKINSKISQKFSAFSVFVIITSISCLLYSYFGTMFGVVSRDSPYTSPNKLSDMVVYYSKEYAPKKDDGILMISIWIAHQFPEINYLEKANRQKFHVATMQANYGFAGNKRMFPNGDPNQVFAFSYLFEDVKKVLQNPKTKVIFVNNTPEIMRKDHYCLIGTLEYYFLDPGFKKTFLKNFHFENRVVINYETKPLQKISFITGEEPSIFDQIKPSKDQILHDFEVYVRNEN